MRGSCRVKRKTSGDLLPDHIQAQLFVKRKFNAAEPLE